MPGDHRKEVTVDTKISASSGHEAALRQANGVATASMRGHPVFILPSRKEVNYKMRLFGVSLGEGTTKVGDVLTFSLPSKITCPGASVWCLKRCYGWRYEKRRPVCLKAYHENLALTSNPQEFERIMSGVLPRITPCFRIHVSGDFHTIAYIENWIAICRAFPQTLFWSYTRSWAVPEFRDALEKLRSLPNVQLFASVDETMPLPPSNWRKAYVYSDPRAQGIACATQMRDHGSCLECGFCFRVKTGDVIFRVH